MNSSGDRGLTGTLWTGSWWSTGRCGPGCGTGASRSTGHPAVPANDARRVGPRVRAEPVPPDPSRNRSKSRPTPAGATARRESRLGTRADIDTLNQRITHLEQQAIDLRLQQEERDDDQPPGDRGRRGTHDDRSPDRAQQHHPITAVPQASRPRSWRAPRRTRGARNHQTHQTLGTLTRCTRHHAHWLTEGRTPVAAVSGQRRPAEQVRSPTLPVMSQGTVVRRRCLGTRRRSSLELTVQVVRAVPRHQGAVGQRECERCGKQDPRRLEHRRPGGGEARGCGK